MEPRRGAMRELSSTKLFGPIDGRDGDGWKTLSVDPLLPLQLDDLVGLGAAGGPAPDLRAFLLADQRAGERRGDGDPALLGVGLRLADDLPHRLLVGVLVDQGDGGAEGDGVAGKF